MEPNEDVTTTPARPEPTPYRVELAAMETIATTFDPLDRECRERLLSWISQRYRVGYGNKW